MKRVEEENTSVDFANSEQSLEDFLLSSVLQQLLLPDPGSTVSTVNKIWAVSKLNPTIMLQKQKIPSDPSQIVNASQ